LAPEWGRGRVTFDQPLWLVLLTAVPLVWWLHRRIAMPREVRVSSVEALRGAASNSPSARPRRRLDVPLLLLLSGVICLSLAAAGARLGTNSPSVLVVVDNSASGDQRGTDGTRLRDSALRSTALAIAAAGPDLMVEVLGLGSATSTVLVDPLDLLADDATVPIAPDNLSADDLPRSLAPALRFASAHGYAGLVLVTDRDPLSLSELAESGVVLAGPETAPGRDTGILDVVLDGERAVVSVMRDASGPAEVTCTYSDHEERVAVPRLGALDDALVSVELRAPPRGARARIRIEGADSFAANDGVVVERVGGARSIRLMGPSAGRATRLRSLLATLRIAVESSAIADVDAEILVGGPPIPLPGTSPPRLHMAVDPGNAPSIIVVDDPGVVRGAGIAVSGALSDAPPSPGVKLAVTGRMEVDAARVAGSWRSARGLLAVALDRQVLVGLDVEDPASDWAADASFPVLVLTSLDHLTGGPERLVAAGGVPRSEARRSGAPPPPVDVDAVRAVVREATEGEAAGGLSGVLAAVGAGLLAVAVGLSAWQSERFSGGDGTLRTAG
jgi:hypothetical protein